LTSEAAFLACNRRLLTEHSNHLVTWVFPGAISTKINSYQAHTNLNQQP